MRSELNQAIVDQSGSKMAAVVHLVTKILTENSTDRVLIFAQWPQLCSTVATTLDLAGVENCLLLGPAIHRAAALTAFQVHSSTLHHQCLGFVLINTLVVYLHSSSRGLGRISKGRSLPPLNTIILTPRLAAAERLWTKG